MGDKGWNVRVVSDREVEPQGVTADQAQVYQGDIDACSAEYTAAHPPPAITADFARSMYQQELVTMKCLQELGIQVDLPPSEQTYIDEYLRQKYSSWSAYAHVAQNGKLSFAEVEKKCPQATFTGSE